MKTPAVYIDQDRHTCIEYGVKAGKVSFTPLRPLGLCIQSEDEKTFAARYSPIPEYSVKRAAEFYLRTCKFLACDDASLRQLESLVKTTEDDATQKFNPRSNLSKGEPTMSEATTKKPVPQPATKKPATSGGKAAPAAKKPATTKATAKPAPKAAESKAPAKKVADAKPTPAKKAAKPEAAAKKPGRAPNHGDDAKIKVLVKDNPKRGSAAERFALYKNGMTVGEYIDAGGKRPDISWDSKQGWIQVG
jgi:outer membrane biosynthesis protein TonB